MSALIIDEHSKYEKIVRLLETMRNPPVEIQQVLFKAATENREVTPAEADEICGQILNQVGLGWETLAKAHERGIDEDSLIEFGVSLIWTEAAAKILAGIAELSWANTGEKV